MRLKKLIDLWNEFWFTPIEPTSIALFRIAYGVLILWAGASYTPYLLLWFGRDGSLSLEVAKQIAPRGAINLFLLLPPGDGWVIAFFAVFMAATFCLTIGLFTRASSIMVWLCLASFFYRQQPIHNGADNIMRIVSFFLIFSPAGSALSVDRLLRIRRGKESGDPPKSAPWVQRLLQIQLAVIYLTTFYWKALGPVWADGLALYYATRLEDFWKFRIPYLFEHLWSIKLLTWCTLGIEFALGTLIWISQLRYIVMLGGLFLHLGLEYTLDIPFFQWATLCLYITFIEPRHIRMVLDRIRGSLSRSTSRPAEG